MATDDKASGQAGGHDDDPKHFEIFVDGKKHTVETPYLNGAQIKSLGSVPSEYQLFLEQPGDDKQVSDSESVQLKNGMHFYSVPPATFGDEFAI